ncbi:MAG: TIGR03086 family metal-binding protein [Actinomycetota bacterium]
MSQQHIDIWNASADAFTARYEAITDDQWSVATPCAGWNVKELVDHAVGVQAQYCGGLLGAEIPEGADWPTARDAIRAALANEAALEGTAEMGPMGTVPKTVPFGVAASDLLIHTWDVARAIGADETLPEGPVAATHAGLQRFPEAAMRSEGMFGAAVEAVDGADMQTQMLNFAGRTV